MCGFASLGGHLLRIPPTLPRIAALPALCLLPRPLLGAAHHPHTQSLGQAELVERVLVEWGGARVASWQAANRSQHSTWVTHSSLQARKLSSQGGRPSHTPACAAHDPGAPPTFSACTWARQTSSSAPRSAGSSAAEELFVEFTNNLLTIMCGGWGGWGRTGRVGTRVWYLDGHDLPRV